MPIAIVRDISPELGHCELSFVPRQTIDVGRAREQHREYCAALSALGCRVIELPAPAGLPDAVFVEDTALVFDELAVLTRPGAASRQPEVASIAEALAPLRRLVALRAPATLDGGDVLRIGKSIYVGQSARSNPEGIAQLRAAVADHGYTVTAVATRDCLHLKSAVTCVADGVVLVQPAWVDRAAFSSYEQIAVDVQEEHAANVLRIGNGLIYPTSFPRTLERLQQRGLAVTTVDVSELQKAEGAVTCCSLIVANAD